MKTYIQLFFITLLLGFASYASLTANNKMQLENLLQPIAAKQNSNIFINKSDGIKVVTNNPKKQNATVAPKLDSTLANKIVKIWENSDGILNITAALLDSQSVVKIAIHNMLGKEVKNIFSGLPTNKSDDGNYIFTSKTPINLPKGVYIVVMQGAQFRVAEKFIATK